MLSWVLKLANKGSSFASPKFSLNYWAWPLLLTFEYNILLVSTSYDILIKRSATSAQHLSTGLTAPPFPYIEWPTSLFRFLARAGSKPTFYLPSPADNLAYFELLLKLGRLVPDLLDSAMSLLALVLSSGMTTKRTLHQNEADSYSDFGIAAL